MFREQLKERIGSEKTKKLWMVIKPKFDVCIDDISFKILDFCANEKNKGKHNFSSRERNILFSLKNHPTHSVVMADKNLGPIWIETDKFMDACAKQLQSKDFIPINCTEQELVPFAVNLVVACVQNQYFLVSKESNINPKI